MTDNPGQQRANRYRQIIEHVFAQHYSPGSRGFDFARSDLVAACQAIGISVPDNLGDIVYSFRYRIALPEAVAAAAAPGEEWIIRGAGSGRYRFALVQALNMMPNPSLAETKVPDATPGIIGRYALSDEQALLARLRYNRLIDIFTRVTCYSLQSHLRTTVPQIGQVETDEIYVGLDQRGAHYVIPVQAKGGSDRLGRVQIEQDVAMCRAKFRDLICRPIAAQFMKDDVIALFELVEQGDEFRIAAEKHYRLVPSAEVTADDLRVYSQIPVQ